MLHVAQLIPSFANHERKTVRIIGYDYLQLLNSFGRTAKSKRLE